MFGTSPKMNTDYVVQQSELLDSFFYLFMRGLGLSFAGMVSFIALFWLTILLHFVFFPKILKSLVGNVVHYPILIEYNAKQTHIDSELEEESQNISEEEEEIITEEGKEEKTVEQPISPKRLIELRNELWTEILSTRTDAEIETEKNILHSLNTEDDPRFLKLLDLTQDANQLTRTTSPEWRSWDKGNWAVACEGELSGPFSSRDAAFAHIATIPRSYFGALSWQVGIDPIPLVIGEIISNTRTK